LGEGMIVIGEKYKFIPLEIEKIKDSIIYIKENEKNLISQIENLKNNSLVILNTKNHPQKQ